MQRIAILGGGPSGLFMFKRFLELGRTDIVIHIFERKDRLGAGMPYSHEGANDEHITNVSGNEIPALVTPVADWLKSVSKDTLQKYNMDAAHFNEYKVLPRLLFGQYLTAQFNLLQQQAREQGVPYELHYNTLVTDVIDQAEKGKVLVETAGTILHEFDAVVICTGHNWPQQHEGKVPGYFDSPYPPAKLALSLNHPVALKGSSLTAVDAIRTLARCNGTFIKNDDGVIAYQLSEESQDFKMVMHTRNGMLPAMRFHLEDPLLTNRSLLTDAELAQHIADNDGFLSLDFIFEQDFKAPIREKDPKFYESIKDLNLEGFVAAMMALREKLDPFQLLQAEYTEAAKSIRREQSVYWKEMLGVLSFALNYPAKYLSAEDMQRLQQSLTPLISIVIAYLPQRSGEELLALHKAGVLHLVPVGKDSEVKATDEGGAIYHYTTTAGEDIATHYKTYVDCVGQPHLEIDQFPFKSLVASQTVSHAKLRFRSADEGSRAKSEGLKVTLGQDGYHYLRVSGIAINDYFQVVDSYGAANERVYIMAVPYIGGYNPDYSGLDFSEAASAAIVKRIFL